MSLNLLASMLSLPVILFALWRIIGRMGFSAGLKILMIAPGVIYFLYLLSSEFMLASFNPVLGFIWLVTSYVLFLLPLIQAVVFLFFAFKKWPAEKATK